MMLEAVEGPIRYQWPKGEIRLTPGQPVDVPSDRAQKILKKCGAKVRHVQPDWYEVWCNLAKITDGITEEDRRFGTIMTLLGQCDAAFEQDDWVSFQKLAQMVTYSRTKP